MSFVEINYNAKVFPCYFDLNQPCELQREKKSEFENGMHYSGKCEGN